MTPKKLSSKYIREILKNLLIKLNPATIRSKPTTIQKETIKIKTPILYTLKDFRLEKDNSNIGKILIAAHTSYRKIIEQNFSFQISFFNLNPNYKNFKWGIKIPDSSPENISSILQFLELCRKSIRIDCGLEACFALGIHTEKGQRSELGNLVFVSKSYPNILHPGNPKQAYKIERLLENFIQNHPMYRKADFILAMPPSSLEKDFDLPAFLALRITQNLKIQNGKGWIEKVRTTKAQKDCRNNKERLENLSGAFRITKAVNLEGKTLILLDDICRSSVSLQMLGGILQNRGTKVLGLVISKTDYPGIWR